MGHDSIEPIRIQLRGLGKLFRLGKAWRPDESCRQMPCGLHFDGTRIGTSEQIGRHALAQFLRLTQQLLLRDAAEATQASGHTENRPGIH